MIMIRINLLPREEQPSKEEMTWSRIFIWALIGAALVVIVGAGIHVFRIYERSNLKADIAEAQRELGRYEGQAAMVRDLTTKRQAIQQRIEVIEKLDNDRFLRVFMLDELARSVPDYVWLESAEEKSGTVSLKGLAFSNLAISQLMDDLTAKDHVDSVYLRVIKKDEVENQSVLSFELGYRIRLHQIPKPAAKSQGSKPREGAKSS
jgi:type IV pilus assembly protein PilN